MNTGVSRAPGAAHGAEDPSSFPFSHIACCIDESGASRYALREAVRLRSLAPGRLTIVHVTVEPMLYELEFGVDVSKLRAAARDWLVERAAEAPGAHTELLVGNPPVTVTQWVGSTDVDLLVAAPHKGLRDRIVLGSFASYLAHHSPIPVLLPREPETALPPRDGTPYRHIACCVDLSQAAMDALALARRLRAAGPGHLTALHAAYLPPAAELGLGSTVLPTQEELEKSAAGWLGDAIREMPEVKIAVVGGSPRWACEVWARQHRCDLMVAASHRGLAKRAVLGSFAGHLAHHAPCSVLLTRPSAPEDAMGEEPVDTTGD